MTKFSLGDEVYYPVLREGIFKQNIHEIKISGDGVIYKVSSGRLATDDNIFKTFEEAREYCLQREKLRYEKQINEIMTWSTK